MFVLTAKVFHSKEQSTQVLFASQNRSILQDILAQWYKQVDRYSSKPLPNHLILENYLFIFDKQFNVYTCSDKEIPYDADLYIEETLKLE